MSKRTLMYQKLPWSGGVNDSVDPGVLRDDDLVTAENLVFATSGSRLKREGLTYLDTDIPTPDFRTSSGTSKTLTYTTVSIQQTGGTDDQTVADGETITVAGVANYAATEVVATVAHTAQIATVTTVADSAGSLNSKYFLLDSAEGGTQYYVWLNINSAGVDPEVSGRTGVEVAGATNVSAADIATAIQTAVHALTEFTATVLTNVVTITAATAGICVDPEDVDTGFTIAVTTEGKSTIAYTGTVSNNETITAAGAIVVTREEDVLSITDYWRTDGSNVQQQALITMTNKGKMFSYNSSGRRTEVTGSFSPSSDLTTVRAVVFNNKIIHCFSGVTNTPIKYRPEDSASYAALANAPDCALMTSYLSRLWCNDKTDPHRVHYSTTGNEEEWNGDGDSGALDIDPGDGDPIGITAIYSFKGSLFIAKKTKIYRVLGDSPENFQIVPVTKGLGAEGSMVVNVDQDDAVFVSKRGIHSAQATDQFGDVSSKFLSAKIQNTFNGWSSANLSKIQGTWLPELNSLILGVPAKSALNDTVWLFNVEQGSWYTWPGISCQSVSNRLSGNILKPVFGTKDGRVIQAQNGDYIDFGDTAYTYKVKTGRIYPGGNPQTMKAFKKIGFFYKPVGDFQFTVRIKIDNASTQALVFQQESTTELLGVDFVLGQSILGFSDVLSPYVQSIDGYGRGLTIEIEQASADQQVEIYGFVVEYEEEGFRQEVQND